MPFRFLSQLPHAFKTRSARIAAIFFGYFFLTSLLLTLTSWQLFPCLTFVWDSDRAVQHTFCALFDGHGRFLLHDRHSIYYLRPSAWTWAASAVFFLVLPFIAAFLTHQAVFNRVAKDAKLSRDNAL